MSRTKSIFPSFASAAPVAAEAPPVEAPDVAAEAPPVEPPVETTGAAETTGVVRIRSKVGVMVHPFKHVTFGGGNVLEFVAIDSWLQSQIDEGKLEVVK